MYLMPDTKSNSMFVLFQQKDVVILEMCFFYFFWNVAILDVFSPQKKTPRAPPRGGILSVLW